MVREAHFQTLTLNQFAFLKLIPSVSWLFKCRKDGELTLRIMQGCMTAPKTLILGDHYEKHCPYTM